MGFGFGSDFEGHSGFGSDSNGHSGSGLSEISSDGIRLCPRIRRSGLVPMCIDKILSCRKMPMKIMPSISFQAASNAKPPKGPTVPKPFHLTSNKAKHEAGYKFHSDAEKVIRFQKDTPERFRSRPRNDQGW